MIKLFDYLNESILDDEDVQLDRIESDAKRPELKKLVRLLWLKGYRIGSDDKTIISRSFGDYYKRKEWLYLSDFDTDTLKKFHTLGLQFSPISYLAVKQKELDSLKYLNCISIGSIHLKVSSNQNINLDEIKYDVDTLMLTMEVEYNKKISSSKSYDAISIETNNGNKSADFIKNWKCNYLFIDEAFVMNGEDKNDLGYSIETIQKIIDNNPQAKYIYIKKFVGGSLYYKFFEIRTKKNKFYKLINSRQIESVYDHFCKTYGIYSWEREHKELWDYEYYDKYGSEYCDINW